MADDTDTAAELVSGGCEVRKSSVRRGAGSGVEVRVRAVRRRSWATEDKLRIVRETLEPGAVATAVADRHGISTGLLFTWRKQMLATAMSGFVPVDVGVEKAWGYAEARRSRSSSRPSRTAARTWSMRCAPTGDQRICRRLFMRALTS